MSIVSPRFLDVASAQQDWWKTETSPPAPLR
jgi:hypothetical protein